MPWLVSSRIPCPGLDPEGKVSLQLSRLLALTDAVSCSSSRRRHRRRRRRSSSSSRSSV